MDLLLNHRSIRNFSDKEISEDVISDLLNCGVRASNTGNMQLYSIVYTTDIEKKKLLLGCHFQQKMDVEAPLLITICFYIKQLYIWC